MDVWSVLRVVVTLGVVFGALFYAHRWVTKGRPGSAAKAKQIEIVARQGLGSKAGVVVVDAGGRRYLLGVTEHTVTVLDTLGEVPASPTPALVATQPVTVARFEQELRTVTITTGDVPVLVHGRAGDDDPRGPITQTFAITPAPAAGQRPAMTIADLERGPAPVQTTRRALREAEQRSAQVAAGPLAGSVLSPTTWRQTVDALRRGR